MNKPLTLKQQLQDARRDFVAGLITLDQLYAAADAYIAAVKAHCKQIGKRPPHLTRHGLLR
jgi:hypothetical protein